MGKIQRGTIAEDFRNGLDLDSSRTGIYPNESSDKIVLTYDYSNTARNIQIKRLTADNSGGTIFTSSSEKNTLIHALSLGWCKDATATSTNVFIRVTIGGTNVYPLEICGLTTTADAQSTTISFPKPILIDKNTSVSIATTGYGGGLGHYIHAASIIYEEIQ
jgi:hypothetical protein